ncbi:MAG: Fe-S cluster assembly protein SufD [Capsulimonadaceae bacterium]|nr:Fe-S cluster assembly protein SufD [Capsulimonadaceae bacterium]
MTATIDTNNKYAEDFDRLLAARATGEPSWLTRLRRRAFCSFSELGFPTRKHEEWRFTPIPRIIETPFGPSRSGAAPHDGDAAAYSFGELGGDQIVFVDGYFDAALSSIESSADGVRVGSLAAALADDPGALDGKLGAFAPVEGWTFSALNAAFFADGAYVLIPRNVVLEAPIQILYLSTGGERPTVSYPRTLVIAERGSQATVVESYASSSGELYFTNAVTEFYIGENAVVDHYKVTREGVGAQHISVAQVEIERNGRFKSNNITLGGSLVRNDVNAHLAGEGIVCVLNGLYMARGKQLVDNHTFIDHANPNCESHELYKGILADRSRGVFNGKILVRPDAQKTDAKQTNKTLLLSKEATIDTKPQLEIFADDVKCTHGATVGQADEEAVFYLRSRGIGEEDARSLLTYAFASDIVSRIAIEPIRQKLDEALFTEGALQGIR